MRILMIAPGQLPLPGGGSVEICVSALAKEWAAGHEVTVVSRVYPGLRDVEHKGNLTLVRLPSGSRERYLSSVLAYVKGTAFDRVQVDNRPGYLPEIKAAFPGTPVSIFLHSKTFVSGPRTETLERLAHADLIVANSRSLQEDLSIRFPELAGRMRFVHLGADLRHFRPPTTAERRSLRKRYKLRGSFVVVFAGRVIPRKGLHVVIRAMRRVRRRVPNATLVVAGGKGSRYEARMKMLARRLGVETRFLGRLPHHFIRRAYWMGDCFVCPSQKHEAFGLVNSEAMAAGLPCVASDIGGIPEVILHRETGLLVKQYARPEAFAANLIRIADDKAFARRLTWRAREEAKAKFGWGTAAENLLRLYGDGPAEPDRIFRGGSPFE